MLSSFDIETYARTQRENMMREAEMARKVGVALSKGQVYRSDPLERVARRCSAAQCWLAARGAAVAGAFTQRPAVSSGRSSLIHHEAARRQRPAPATDPYAGMIVVAHAGAALAATPPAAVTDHNRAA